MLRWQHDTNSIRLHTRTTFQNSDFPLCDTSIYVVYKVESQGYISYCIHDNEVLHMEINFIRVELSSTVFM